MIPSIPTMPTLKFGFFKKRWEFLSRIKKKKPEESQDIKQEK